MLAVYMEGFRLSWLRFLWRALGLPRALRPGRGIRFSQSGLLYGRRRREWNKGRPKALKSPPTGGSALPAARTDSERIGDIARDLAKVSARGGMSVREAVSALKRLRFRADRELIEEGRLDEVVARRAREYEDQMTFERLQRQGGPKQPPAPIKTHSLNEKQGRTSAQPCSASVMAAQWRMAVLKDWAEAGAGSPVVCTEYQRGIAKPVWNRLVEDVNVSEVRRGLANRLIQDGLLVEFPVDHVAQTRRIKTWG